MNDHPDCESIHALLDVAADVGPSAGSRHRIDRHLVDCDVCRRDVAFTERVTAVFASDVGSPVPHPGHEPRLRAAVAARRRRSLIDRITDWVAAPVPAYGAVAAALALVVLVGVLSDAAPRPTSGTTVMATVADTSLPQPVLTRADSYDVLSNIRLLDLSGFPLLTDSLDRSALPGAQL